MKTKVLVIHPSFPELDKIAECANVLCKGGLVIFPTETVYGLAANFSSEKAMKRLRQVKKRAKDKPFSVLVAKKDDLDELSSVTDRRVYKLVDEFWPGPLTLIVPAKEEGKTIGLRMPQNNIALYLVHEAQCPLAAPSANVEGADAPVTCQEALKDLDGLVEIAIDGGPATYGQSSTVVDMTTSAPTIVRQGPIGEERIKEVINRKTVLFVCTGNSCRSVMAEYLLKKKLGNRKDVEVISAGTSVYVSIEASADTALILEREGIDASRHLSQSVNKIMLEKADLIIAMTRGHRQFILEKAPNVKNRVYLLREFAKMKGSEAELDLPDPIGKPYSVYEECMWEIKEAIEKIVNLI